MHRNLNYSHRAFSLIQLVVVLAILLVLVGLITIRLIQAYQTSLFTISMNNQRTIVAALLGYAYDNQGNLPQMVAMDSPIRPGYTIFWTRKLVYYGYIEDGSVLFRPGNHWGRNHHNLQQPTVDATIPWAYPSYGVNAYGAMPQKNRGTYNDYPANLFRVGGEASRLMLLRDIHHPAYMDRDYGWYWWGGGESVTYLPQDDGGFNGMMSAAYADGHVESFRISELREILRKSSFSGSPVFNRVWTRD